MKKFILSFSVTALFLFYIVFQRSVARPPVTAPALTKNNPTAASSSPADTTSSPANSHISAAQTSTGAYKNGQYTGPSINAYYGNVQVKAIISGGKISDVQFLDYPQDRRNSQEINSQAMPYLTAEAIQAQSAKVDIVSGATDTSQAFIQSLTSALTQARI